MLDVKGLSKRFDGVHAVERLDVSLKPGEITAIIGPNGAGKTTLFHLISGFLPPDDGHIYYRGKALVGLPPHRIARMGVIRTFQDLRLIRQMSIKEHLQLVREYDDGHADLLALVGLREAEYELAGNLSYGQQKLLSIACCLAAGGSCLLFDEPVAGVHPHTAEGILRLLQILKQDGKTVVFIEHDLDAVRSVADRVIVMDEGKIIADGSAEAVLKQRNVLEAYLA